MFVDWRLFPVLHRMGLSNMQLVSSKLGERGGKRERKRKEEKGREGRVKEGK